MKRKTSLLLVLVLLLQLLAGFPVFASDISLLPDHIIINQVYGTADKTDGAISRSFIELYNPTDADIDMSTYAIHYATQGGAWNMLELTGQSIPARTSFLIISTDPGKSTMERYTIPAWDMEWAQEIDNKSVNIALVSNQNPLSAKITGDEMAYVIDLVGIVGGAGDAVLNFEGSAPADGQSKQKSLRRIKFADFDDNYKDFEVLDYRSSGISDTQLEMVRPRCTQDGQWGLDIFPDERVPEAQRLFFSVPAGSYENAFDLELTTGYTNGTICYTMDGSDPTPDSQIYTAPLSITDASPNPNVLSLITNIGLPFPKHNGRPLAKGTVIKAQVFDAQGNPLSNIVTQSYFVGLTANYEGLPIISLATDASNLFDPSNGIYVHYDNKGSAWERPVHFEMIEPDGTLGVSLDMGVRIHGGYSRNFPQKTFRLYAKKGYDANYPRLTYDVFDGNAKNTAGDVIDSFQRILLRQSGNDGSKHGQAGTPTMIRDALQHTLAHDLNVPGMAYRQSVLFLNGEFWGIYNIRQRIDEYYVQDMYHITDTGKVVILDYGQSHTPGDYHEDAAVKAEYDHYYMPMYNWFNAQSTLADPADYAKAQTFLDIDNYIDYIALNVFSGNGDWPSNNMVMWRYHTESYPDGGTDFSNAQDGRWRYILKDMDFGFASERTTAVNNAIARLLEPEGYDQYTTDWSTIFFRKLMTNPEFKNKFVNRLCDIMNTNAKAGVVIAKIDEMSAKIEPAIEENISRWDFVPDKNRWNSNLEFIRNFARNREAEMHKQMKAALGLTDVVTVTAQTNNMDAGYVRINDININAQTDGVTDPANWSGRYFKDQTLSFTAVASEGYEFEKFIINGQDVTGSNAVTRTLDGDTTVMAIFHAPSAKNHTVDAIATVGGIVSGGGIYEEDATATLTATADAGYQFDGWYENGDLLSALNPYAFIVRANHAIEGRFSEIVPDDRAIVSVDIAVSKTVPYGTAFEDLLLPAQAIVTLSDTGTETLSIDWSANEYNAFVPEAYTLTGTLVLKDGIINPDHIQAQAVITVSKRVFSAILTPPAITGVENGAAKAEILAMLPKQVTITTNGGNMQADVSWNDTLGGYDPANESAQLLAVTGVVALPADVENPQNIALDTTITVAVKAKPTGEEIAVSKIKINASGLFTLSVKKKARIPVTIEPSNATDQSVKWISTNPNIFTVDKDGNITPKKQGTATLTAQSANGLKSTIIVRITA